MIAAVVLGAALLVTVAIIVWRQRRRGGDLIGRHERAMSTLRDFYEHPLPDAPGFGNGHHHHDIEAEEVELGDGFHAPLADSPAAAGDAPASGVAPAAPVGRDNGSEAAAVRRAPPRSGYPGPVAPREVPDLRRSVAAARDTSERATRQSISAVGALATPMREPDHPIGNGRYRRGLIITGGAVAVIVVIAAIVGLVSGTNSPHRSSSPPVAVRSQSSPTTTIPTTTSTIAPTSTTVVATNPTVVDRNGTPTVVVHAPFALTLAASQPCWVEVRDATNGQDLFVGTLQSGQTQQVPVPGNAHVRIGNSRGISISIDGNAIDTQTLGNVSNLDLSSA